MKTLLSFLILFAALPVLAQNQGSARCKVREESGTGAPVSGRLLPSWRDTAVRQQIIDFVDKTTRPESATFIPEADRIAVFDNDGTLWSEQPMYVQLAFVLDRIRTLSASHPDLRYQEPFRSAINGDLKAVFAGGEEALVKLTMHTHAGMSPAEFEAIVNDWIKTARHPKTGCLYTEMVYSPMLELIDYLHSRQYKVFIVSGGGAEFIRAWVEAVYKIPRERVIGSTIRSQYRVVDGVPQLTRLPEIEFINDKAGKPVGIARHIGRRPIIAVGNSDGDLEMLLWTTSAMSATQPRLGLLLHHTDDKREVAYDRKSSVGRLDKALNLAPKAGWTIIDMKQDWDRVFPFLP